MRARNELGQWMSYHEGAGVSEALPQSQDKKGEETKTEETKTNEKKINPKTDQKKKNDSEEDLITSHVPEAHSA